MASTLHLLLFSLLPLLLLLSPSAAIKPQASRPRALLLRTTKDPTTLQYLTEIHQRTPLVPVKLTLDLGGEFLWVNCEHSYVSSSYRPIPCGSPMCKLFQYAACGDCSTGPKPGCNQRTCGLSADNTIPGFVSGTQCELSEDIISVQSTDGSNPGPTVVVPHFPFTCGYTRLLKGLAAGVSGMAGLGWGDISLPSHLASTLHFSKKFAVCLAGSAARSNGVIFFGGGPYNFLPNHDVSKNLMYTPLLKDVYNQGNIAPKELARPEYYIGVKSIRINNRVVPLNVTLLSIIGAVGGTKISTVVPYTLLESSIYKAFTLTFMTELAHVPTVAPVKPFTVCYDSTYIKSTRVGPPVPDIDFVMQGEKKKEKEVYWRVFGANSMVEAHKNVLCLGFVDGGVNLGNAIVIGGYQLENNLLEFDLEKSRLGFSSSLLLKQTTCANFNFTSVGK